MLSVTDHRRNSAGLTYVYPVISRRAGGLSIGINLNTNNACNWRCIYCQVPDLKRGGAPRVDLDKLEQELRGFLDDVLEGDFYETHRVPPEDRTIRDIALSGNGEPTSSREFDQVVTLLGIITADLGLVDQITFVLVTNGSLVQRRVVQAGISQLSELNGEVWFKLDSTTNAGIHLINNARTTKTSVAKNLEAVAKLCRTWIQTCVFSLDGEPPSKEEREAYRLFLSDMLDRGVPFRGVLLYGMARPSMQPEAPRLGRLPLNWLEEYANEIRPLGIEVRVNE
ncbi:MAG: radical SAM protein [Gammaproteobacteria bacterium]